MSATEIIVIVVGLLGGYWVVSFFSAARRTKTPASQTPPEPERSEEQSDDRRAPPNEDRGWADVLEVSPTASTNEIRTAYKQLMSQYHPDKVAALGVELKALAERKTKEITSAYRDAMRARGVGE